MSYVNECCCAWLQCDALPSGLHHLELLKVHDHLHASCHVAKRPLNIAYRHICMGHPSTYRVICMQFKKLQADVQTIMPLYIHAPTTACLQAALAVKEEEISRW